MKPLAAKFAKPPKTSLFQTARKPGAQIKGADPEPASQKRENIFSKSRDTREARSARQMKMSRNPQTLSHGR